MQLDTIPINLWALLAVGPVAFFLCFVALSVLFSVTGTAPADVAGKVTALLPHCLVIVLGIMGVLLLIFMKAEASDAWSLPSFSVVTTDFIIGALVGLALAIIYLKWLQHLVSYLQYTFGDYVPVESTLSVLSGSIVVFFIANVLLAPVVEETLYRGIALPLLGNNLGIFNAVIISCLAFGLLHWAGGFWYMLLTGIVAGGIFSGLYYWRGGIVAPFAAHFVLNIIEFAYLYVLKVKS